MRIIKQSLTLECTIIIYGMDSTFKFYGFEKTKSLLNDLISLRNDFLYTEDIQSAAQKHMLLKGSYTGLYVLALCTEGQYDCYINEKRHELTKRTLMLMRIGELYRTIESTNYKGYLIMFTPDFLISENQTEYKVLQEPIFKNYGNNTVTLTKEQFRRIKSAFQQTKKRAKDTTHCFRYEVIQKTILLLLYEIAAVQTSIHKNLVTNEVSYKRNLLSKFETLLEIHYIKERKVQFYAEKLYITSQYLNRIIKEITNFSASEMIQNRVLMEIKVRITTTSTSIKNLAYEFSFSDETSFIRFFRNKTGITPISYRKQNHITSTRYE